MTDEPTDEELHAAGWTRNRWESLVAIHDGKRDEARITLDKVIDMKRDIGHG